MNLKYLACRYLSKSCRPKSSQTQLLNATQPNRVDLSRRLSDATGSVEKHATSSFVLSDFLGQAPSTAARTGLFGKADLQHSDGFHTLRDKAFRQADKLVEEIISSPAGSDNVVALFDELSNCLCRVADLAEFVRIGHPQSRFRATAEHASLAISTLVERLNTNPQLYQALKQSRYKDELDEYVAKLFILDFEQSGIHLDDATRNVVLELNESILKLGCLFAANAHEGRLVRADQIPKEIRHVFAVKQLKNSENILIDSLHADSANELVRETAYKIYLSPDDSQEAILSQLLNSRLKLARLCGFQSYAHRAVKGSIAGSPEVVREFLEILNDEIKPMAEQDYRLMLELKARETREKDTARCELKPWDVPYYSSKYKRGIYNENVLQCLPYFSINSCFSGLNMIFQRLYGVRMQLGSCAKGETWHNSVIKLGIMDEETDSLLGYIYCDLFERQFKQSQDCHHTIQGGCYLRDGSYQLPIVVLVLNLPEPNGDKSSGGGGGGQQSLLSPSMVDNLFHEMGHAMHSMLARTKYQHITGTRCSTDLAEVPSILMEFFASDARVVGEFARHHESGARMPEELISSWIESKRVLAASETQLQVFYAALDQAYHTIERPPTEAGEGAIWTRRLLASVQAQYYSLGYVPGTAWQLRFSHLVGYGAKYYSYLVSRAVAGAIWAQLFAADPLSRAAGQRYKREVLAPGGSKPARQIAEAVLGYRVDARFIARSIVACLQRPDA